MIYKGYHFKISANGNLTVSEEKKYVKVSAGAPLGGGYSLAIDEEGNLWVWGDNTYGQLGDGTKVEKLNPIQINLDINIKAIETETSSSIVIDENNTLWQTGSWSNCSLVDVTYPTLERIY